MAKQLFAFHAISYLLALSCPSLALPVSNLDPNDPSASDPTTPPSNISFPINFPPNPFPSGIPTQPDICDGYNPSNDCFQALATLGGYIFFDKDSGCSNDDKAKLETAVWDAHTLATYASPFPNAGKGTRGQASAIFYMGSDFASQQKRIAGNLNRVAGFKSDNTSPHQYITVSCKDTQNLCGTINGGKSVGGYAWSTHEGYWYNYITVCPLFLQLDGLSDKLSEVEEDLDRKSTKMAADMRYLKTSGQFFLHEMMHTRLADNGLEPHINDEYVAPIPKGERPGTNDVKAYGPKLVHNLAKRPVIQGGGATRASTNADSYAILANAIW